MHTLLEVPIGMNGTTHVPAFLAKLWKIVDDSRTNDLISWSETGNSFIITDQSRFARDLLPLYYKHNNMASFVRQLNMYGFHKVVSIEKGGLRVESDDMEFAHPFFQKGQEALLELVKRKIPASKHEEPQLRPDSFNKVLLDVRQMKGRQESMDNKLLTMKHENEALWRELASLRQKHAKQTQIVNKLLQFLVGMMSQQTSRLGIKRRIPLMLNDKNGSQQKFSRTNATSEPRGPAIQNVTKLFEPNVNDYVEMDKEQGEVGQVDESLRLMAEELGGCATTESRDVMFSLDPSLNIDQAEVENASIESHLSNFAEFQNKLDTNLSQMLQIPTSPLPEQTENHVPTTLYFSAPGMSEPVQVVLSIPNQTTATVPNSGISNAVAPYVLSSSTTSTTTSENKPLAVQRQPIGLATTTSFNRLSNNDEDNTDEILDRYWCRSILENAVYNGASNNN